MKYLFLDTNIYLHYTDTDEIDWKKFVTKGEDFEIIVPPVIRQEINKHKDSGRGKVQKRAKKISAKFGEIFINGKEFKCKYSSCKTISADLFKPVGFNTDDNDDVLILTALHHNGDASNNIIVSSDMNLLIRAKESDIPIYEISDDYKLKEELSDEEKENVRIRKELDKYKNRKPKPSVVFENEKQIVIFKKPDEIDIERELSVYMDKSRRENPYKNMNFNNILSIMSSGFSPEQVRKYNDDLTVYFSEIEKYKKRIILSEMLNQRFKELKFNLINKGTKSTGYMNIYIKFPGDLKLYSNQSRIRETYEAPVQPTLSLFNFLPSPIIVNPPRHPSEGQDVSCQYSWNVKNEMKTNEFRLMQDDLIHDSRHREIDIKDSIFIDTATCMNFSIEVEIAASELIESVKEKLNVKIE